MAEHKTYGVVTDPTAAGKPTRTIFYGSSWPVRPPAGYAVIWIGPMAIANPTDFTSGDLRVKY